MSRADDTSRYSRLPRPLRTVRLALHYLQFNLHARMEYRASFIVQVLGMMLNNSAFIVFWLILFDQLGASIKGYSFIDVMFLWALAAAGFGLAGVTMGNASQISRMIYRGELDVYLLQPKPVLINIVASRMSISAWGDLAYGVALFFLTQPIRFDTIGLFLLFSVLAALLLTSLRVFYHSLTFFLGNAEDFASTASDVVLSFVLYPGSIFDGPIVWVLHSIVPAALIAYIPISIFRGFDLARFAGLIAADAAIFFVSVTVFHLGLRRYESGNRMGTWL